MIQLIKKSSFVKNILKTRLGRYVQSSEGDWRYPWITLSWFIAGLLVPRRKVRCDGVQFTLSCTNPITHFRWHLFARKEAEVRKYINEHVRDGDVFFDVGANVGVFTIYAACRNQDARVYSFEPEHSNLALLKENILANGLMNRVKITSVAVSDRQGLSFLHIQDTIPGAAAHTEHTKALEITDEGYRVAWQEGIATATLDALAEHWGVYPNSLKIDTDGNEDKVLRGASAVLNHEALRSLALEMPLEKTKVAACEKMLKEAGFSLIWSQNSTRNQIWGKTR